MPRSPSTRQIILIYLAFGSLWILSSDWILGLFVHDPAQIIEWQGYKGIAFVVATAVLLHGLLSYHDRRLRQSEARVRLLIRHAPAALAMFDNRMCFMEVSDRWRKDFDLPADAPLRGRSHYEVHPDIPLRWREVHERALQGETVRNEDDYFVRGDGRIQWQRWEVRPWYLADRSVGGIIIFAEDISAKKAAEQELRIAAKAFETRQAMLITDPMQRILRVNRAFCEATGYKVDEVVGKTPSVLQSGRHDAGFYRQMWAQLEQHGEWQGEIWNRRKNGQIYPQWLHISSVVDEDNCVTHYIGTCDDLSAHKQAEEQIHSLSYYDVLTRLPNRRLLMDRMQQALLGSARSKCHGAVFFIDLDKFSTLNDTQGHDVGDQVLLAVSRKLIAAVREDDTVARLGSDEFVVVVENLEAERDAAFVQARDIGETLLAAVREPLQIRNLEYAVTASIGVSLFSDRDDTVSSLLQRADAAMIQVKRIGRDCIHFFDAAMQEALQRRVQLEAQLRAAIPVQLMLHYQPQVDIDGRIFGAEALVRWQHPESGLVSPAEFVPLAEESGLILPMGQFILRTACEQLARWASMARLQSISVSVNVSPRQYQHVDFVPLVTGIIEATGANPRRLILEITENILFEDLEGVTEKMQRLQALGIRFSLDDFGTGFSSLGYLKRLPVDELKIDQSFIRDLEKDDDNAAIVRTVITLGRSLGLSVIAEGVETAGARARLAEEGCVGFQGYHFARPMPVDELELLLLEPEAGERPRITHEPSLPG